MTSVLVSFVPLSVGAQYGDSQDEVHHDREDHHAEAQQHGPVLSRPQSRHRLPLVQDVIFTTDGSEKKVYSVFIFRSQH